MSSREQILKEIAESKPAPVPLPTTDFSGQTEAAVQTYLDVLRFIGGEGRVVDDLQEVQFFLEQRLQEGAEVVNGISSLQPFTIKDYVEKTATEIESVYTVFLEGSIAVAENSAIWLSEKSMVNRLLPFLCQELVLTIREENIVATMHEAYANISVADDGYGVFVAGPSKTADIEQALVIGAHGPLQLKVFILKANNP